MSCSRPQGQYLRGRGQMPWGRGQILRGRGRGWIIWPRGHTGLGLCGLETLTSMTNTQCLFLYPSTASHQTATYLSHLQSNVKDYSCLFCAFAYSRNDAATLCAFTDIAKQEAQLSFSVTFSDLAGLAKYSMTRSVARSLYDSGASLLLLLLFHWN